MSTIERTCIKSVVISFVAVSLWSLACPRQANAAWLREILSNFDLHNLTPGDVSGVEVTLAGILKEDILRLYTGEASRGWIPSVREGEGEITIVWEAPENVFLQSCRWVHLGLSLRAGAPPVHYAKATWTLDGEPVETIGFVWQDWVGYADSSVGEIILPPAVFPVVPGTQEPSSLAVERRWAPSPDVIPLDNLTRYDRMVQDLNWSEKTWMDELTPESGPSEMKIPPTDEKVRALVVQYTVTPDYSDRPAAVFTNEAQIVHDDRPQPRIIRPVDNLLARPNLVYGVVSLWATESTGLWDDQVLKTSFEVSRDGGERWRLVGEDKEGKAPTFSTTEDTYQRNWWNVLWDTSAYPEGEYLVRATMVDRQQRAGEDIIEVYVDPTPPVPELSNLQDHQVFLEPTELSCRTLDEDIVSVVWEVQLKPLLYTKGIPPLDQHDYGVGQVNNGNQYCAPTGSAACLKWWAANGYAGLTQDAAANPLTNTQLVEGLAGAMGTSSITGTTGPGIVNGLRTWIGDRGLLLTVKEHATINPSTIRNEVENCKEDVILGVLWNTGGGHIVTVNSVANFSNADGTTTIGVMDPWVGGTVNITMEPDGDINWPGKAGVQASGLLVSVSPVKLKIPWIFIGSELTIPWDPTALDRGLYFVRATMTDSMGNECSSQIVARVGQTLLPVMMVSPFVCTETGLLNLQWQETEPGKYAYTVEYSEDPASGVWMTSPGKWPIPGTAWRDDITGVLVRFYRVMKDYEPK